tara:strand:- start:1303 stop:2235 length:933 start_codon:yes stop_codon:yes gene_type:complete
MQKIFENFRRFVNEEDNSSVRAQYEKIFPPIPSEQIKKIKRNILRSVSRLKKRVYSTAIKPRGAKRKQYEKNFGKDKYFKALPAIEKALKETKFQIMLGWDPNIDISGYKDLLKNVNSVGGAAMIHEAGKHTVIIFADLLIKSNRLKTYLDTALYHELLGHILAETFERITGINPSKEQWKPEYLSDIAHKGLRRILKTSCLKRMGGHEHAAIQKAGTSAEDAMVKELTAQIVGMAAKGFTQKDFEQLCKDQKIMHQFEQTSSYKKYGKIAGCIVCKNTSSGVVDIRGAVDTINKLAANQSATQKTREIA